MATSGKQIKVVMEADDHTREELYDRVLVSVGRVPNCADLGLENTKVQTDEKGFIKTNPQHRPTMRRSTPSATSPAACCSRTRPATRRVWP